MKDLKKVLLTGTITIATLLTMSISSKAATVKVTGDVINIRKEASTDSSVIAMLSKDVECEYLGEEGDWYKVKYQKYTGYVSKQYTKLVGDTTTESTSQESNTQTNVIEQNNSQTNDENNQNTEQNGNQENNNSANNTQQSNEEQLEESTNTDAVQLVYKKFNQNTIIRILPLIHSSNIGEAKKSDEVLILAETLGWSYIQTDEISGWVRTDTLGDAKTQTTATSNQESENKTKSEKIGYISEDDVNMRKGAGTNYSVLKVLSLNTQVTILEEDGNWYKVKSGDNTGYVSKDYVSDSKKVTNRSLSEPRTEKEDAEVGTTAENTTLSNKITSTGSTTLNNKDTSTEKATTSTDKVTAETDKTTNTSTSSNTSTSNSTKSESITSSDTIKGTDVIAYAKKFLGYKYVWAGDGSNGTFDCSGFTMYVYNHFGISLPHYTVSQYNSSKGTKITKQSDLKMGDIVFLTDYETGAACGHCGIYISDGDFIHADSSVGYVNISNLNGIYKGRFCGALRIF